MAHVGQWLNTIPFPSHISTPAILDPVLEFNPDNGYSIRRPRFTRSLRQYRLEWIGIPTVHRRLLQDYVERALRGGNNTFAWTHPRAETITNVTPGTPVLITCIFGGHGVQTNDQVVVTGVTGTPINAIWTVTWVDATALALNGSSSGAAWTGGGTLQPHFPNMRLVLAEDTFPHAERLIGPDKDNLGLYNIALTFQELA